MAEFLLGGRAIDWILGLVAVEAVVVIALGAFGRGPALLPLLANLLSGAFLLLALRSALSGGSSASIYLCLSASLIAHLADLFGRWDHSASRSASAAQTRALRAVKALIRPAPGASTEESPDA
jgi:hypothetical protein